MGQSMKLTGFLPDSRLFARSVVNIVVTAVGNYNPRDGQRD
jgi:hypothetical protein